MKNYENYAEWDPCPYWLPPHTHLSPFSFSIYVTNTVNVSKIKLFNLYISQKCNQGSGVNKGHTQIVKNIKSGHSSSHDF